MSADLSSGDTSPLKGPAPKALPEDTSDVDRADDAMPLTSPGDQPVQFSPAQPANGDAKVEIGDVGSTPAFVGLGKEELMKYANDPFWVKLRWFLFILFWVLWVAMLVGAIVIIVLAPKCAEQKAHPEAYYELNVKNFAKDGKLVDLGERAEYLASMGFTSVIISDVLKKDDGGGTVDFKEIDESYGTATEFADAVHKLKTEGLRVLLSFVPNHSGTKHAWFADPEKEDYYIRKSEDEVVESTWKTVDKPTVSSWATDSANASIRYLQQFSGTADLNFQNTKVVEEIKNILGFWKGKGVDGFLLSAASYLVEDLTKLKDQSATINQPENIDIVKKILNRADSDPHSLVEVKNLSPADTDSYIASGIVPLSSSSSLLENVDQYNSETEIPKFFKKIQGEENGVIRLSSASDRLANQNPEVADVFRLLAFTSNASVIMYFGDEVDDSKANTMDWDKATASGKTSTFLKKLIQVQKNFVEDKDQNSTFTYPETQEKSTFAFGRSKKYAIIANLGAAEVTVEFSQLLGGSDVKASVLVATPNVSTLKEKEDLTDKVTLPARSAVALEKVE